MKAFTQRPKLAIDILLHGHQHGAVVNSYTSLEEIKGEVSIKAPCNTSFDNIFVTFEGSARTYVERITTSAATNSRTQANHHFLRLTQPIDDSALPPSQTLEAGKTYKVPFNFVVPEQLLPQSCTHLTDTDVLRNVHLRLPPSLGDEMAASDGGALLDDLAPAMSVISYSIQVRMVRGRRSNGKSIVIAESAKKLRIIPAGTEQPPLHVLDNNEEDHILRKEKDIKKGLFKGKLGRLTVEASQPRGIQLPLETSDNTSPLTTMATINIRFDPTEEDAQPPRLGQLINRLKVATFFASSPMRHLPNKRNISAYDGQQGLYVDAVPLSSRNVASVQWEHHMRAPPVRRDSAFSTLSAPAVPTPSSSYVGKSFYSAQILVPVTLPKNKLFTPTFCSCLIARAYILDLQLSVHSPGTTVTASTLRLKVPLQLFGAGNPSATATISADEAQAIAAREADGIFQPRNMAPPSPEYTEHAQLVRPMYPMETAAPPGYSIFSGREREMQRPVSVPQACG